MSQQNNGVLITSDDLMIEVSKEFFIDGMVLPVPIFLQINTGNYLVIGKKGDKTNFTKLHSFKNIATSVFVNKTDYSSLIHHMTDFTSKVVKNKSVPDPIKTKFLVGLTTEALKSFDEAGMGSVGQIQQVSQFVISLNENLNNFSQVLELLAELPNDESKHSMATCMLALMICDEMDIKIKPTLEKVSLGALLHDVGLKFIPKSILDKPRHLWSPEENSIYEAHPLKGVEVLRDLKDISNDVLLIVVEHHENAFGTGYPKKLRDIKISPLGRIVALADQMAELLYGRLPDSKCYTADEAISYIEEILGQPFNKPAFLALKNIINRRFMVNKQSKVS